MKKLLSYPINRYIDVLLFLFLLLYPALTSTYQVLGMSSCVVLAIAALSMDLLWGYTGIMGMGQAVFFGLGAYIAAITYLLQSGMPSFMVTAGLTEVPAVLSVLENPILGYSLAVIVPVLFSIILGKFLLNDRVKGIFLAIITMSLAYLMETLFNNLSQYTGGSNGISGIKTLSFFGEPLSIEGMYYFNVIVLLLIFLLCLFLSKRRFGQALKGIKQNENRMLFLGYHVQNYKITVFAIAAAICAFSGILYVHTTGTFVSSDLGMTMSTNFIILVAIGGRGYLTGALVGSIFLGYMERLIANTIGDIWQLVIGIMLLCIVMFMKEGLVGKLVALQSKRINAKAVSGGK